MIRQIRYFQAVIQNNSFSIAAEDCHISQSAIFQQIRALEREFYRDVVGFQGDFLFAENLEEARLLVVSGKGFMPVEGSAVPFGSTVTRIPLHRGDVQMKRNYCAFWRKDNSGYYTEEFGAILKKQFEA